MAHKEGQQVDTLPSQMYGWDGTRPVKINVDSSGNFADKFAIQIDNVSTLGVSYIGKAAIGSDVSSAVWQIMKLDESGTPITTVITFADGNSNFDNIYSNRTSLTYS